MPSVVDFFRHKSRTWLGHDFSLKTFPLICHATWMIWRIEGKPSHLDPKGFSAMALKWLKHPKNCLAKWKTTKNCGPLGRYTFEATQRLNSLGEAIGGSTCRASWVYWNSQERMVWAPSCRSCLNISHLQLPCAFWKPPYLSTNHKRKRLLGNADGSIGLKMRILDLSQLLLKRQKKGIKPKKHPKTKHKSVFFSMGFSPPKTRRTPKRSALPRSGRLSRQCLRRFSRGLAAGEDQQGWQDQRGAAEEGPGAGGFFFRLFGKRKVARCQSLGFGGLGGLGWKVGAGVWCFVFVVGAQNQLNKTLWGLLVSILFSGVLAQQRGKEGKTVWEKTGDEWRDESNGVLFLWERGISQNLGLIEQKRFAMLSTPSIYHDPSRAAQRWRVL